MSKLSSDEDVTFAVLVKMK